jgi:subtilisin-like proprotein convertase family protein
MKTRISFGILAVILTAMVARGASYTELFNNANTLIPDGNPVGITLTMPVSDIPVDAGAIGGLTVSLNISGGYDGNLYAYLVAPSGAMELLLPGVTPSAPFGNNNPGSGMNITLEDGGTAITSSSDLSSGTYAAAGTLADFNGSSSDGNWELFLADMVSGGGTSELNSWSLDITAVPEPTSGALWLLAGLAGLWWFGGQKSRQKHPQN